MQDHKVSWKTFSERKKNVLNALRWTPTLLAFVIFFVDTEAPEWLPRYLFLFSSLFLFSLLALGECVVQKQ